MDLNNASAVVTGGASGLGLATASKLVDRGVAVTILDLLTSDGEQRAHALGSLASFSPADVRDPEAVDAAFELAETRAPLRALVHCAGRGGTVRLVDREGNAGDFELYREIVDVNLVGTFNVLRLAAAAMVENEPLDGDRGVVVMTASIAAYDGQIGQAAYAASKGGVVGLTLSAARDLADKAIRVVTIAPGTFETPMLSGLPGDVKAVLEKQVPHPSRLGDPAEYANLARHVVDNSMLNGEVIRLDGALRMPPG